MQTVSLDAENRLQNQRELTIGGLSIIYCLTPGIADRSKLGMPVLSINNKVPTPDNVTISKVGNKTTFMIGEEEILLADLPELIKS